MHEWVTSTDPRNLKILEGVSNTGATITGRVTYDLSIQYWGADGPLGPARLPTVVVSHSVPKDVRQGSVYSVVNGIEAAFETAKKLAGDREISIAGANIGQQFLARGLIDEIVARPPRAVEVIETKEVIHQRFRVVK